MRARTTPLCFYATLLLSLAAASAQSQRKPDAATAAWWAQTVALSDDSMEGRDTGTEAYERAAKYVADQFKAAGLKPAGDNGTFFQRVPMHQVDLDINNSSVEVYDQSRHDISVAVINNTTGSAGSNPPYLLQQVTLIPREDLPPLTTGEMVFVGYGLPETTTDLKGKIAVFF